MLEIFFRTLWKNKKEKKTSPLEKTDVDGEAPVKPRTKQMTVYRQDKLLHLVKNEKCLLKEVCDDIYLSQVMNCLWRTAKG